MTARLDIDVEATVKGLDDLDRAGQGMDELGEKTSKMESVSTGAFERIGHKITDFATSLISTGIQSGIEAIGDSLTLASDKAEAASKVNVLYGDSADEIVAASEGAATAVGLSSGAYLTAAGDIGNLITNMGITGDNAADMSQSMITLAADMGSFNNASTEDVTAAMGAAFRGETEPIRQFGVMLDEAGIKAKAMELGLLDAQGGLDAAGRAQATYALILEQTGAAQGDFARTSDGLANQQKIAAAQQEEAWTNFGAALLPIATQITPLITMAIQGLVAALGFVVDNAVPAGAVLGVLGGVLAVTVLPPLIATGLAALATAAPFILLGAAVFGVVLVLQKLGVIDLVLGLLRSLAAMLQGPLQAAFDLIMGVIRRVGELFGSIFGSVQQTLQRFQGVASDVAGQVQRFFQSLGDFLSGLWDTIQGGLDTLAGAFQSIFDGISDTVRGAIDAVVGVFRGLWTQIQSIGGSISRFVGTIFRPLGDAINSALDIVKRAWNTFAGFWNGIQLNIPRIEIPNPLGGSIVLGGGSLGLPRLPTFAQGGVAMRPTAGIFGERGPEALVPLNRARGFGGVTVNVYAGVGDPVEIGREVVDAIHAYERANGPAL
jgi:hypothetical protein